MKRKPVAIEIAVHSADLFHIIVQRRGVRHTYHGGKMSITHKVSRHSLRRMQQFQLRLLAGVDESEVNE